MLRHNDNVPIGTLAGMSGKRTAMSSKDIRRAQLLKQVAQGQRSLRSVSSALGVGYRQAKRIYRRYRGEGPEGLVHRSLGRPSHRRLDEEFGRTVVQQYLEQYAGFGPTFAAEKLSERDRLEVNHETLRRWLIAEGAWKPGRERPKHGSVAKRGLSMGAKVQAWEHYYNFHRPHFSHKRRTPYEVPQCPRQAKGQRSAAS